jgi:D-alanyl-D-alanine carboxypeptidase
MKKRIILCLLCSLFAWSVNATSPETPVDATPDSSSADYTPITLQFPYSPSALPVNENEIKAGLLYDMNNGRIVWQKNLTTPFPIASLTKMMVALLAVEDVRDGKINWTDNLNWTRKVVIGKRRHRRTVTSKANYSLRDVFKATMIASNNECAEQLARYIGNGDLQGTIDRMNKRARELGMMSTYYSNPTGLPSPHWMFDNSSTPTDLLQLTIEMLKYNEVLEITAMGYSDINNGKSRSVIRNHNGLTIEYSGEVDGLKTGYTKRAGFCLVATTAKCDHRLVGIVLGCRGPQIRNEVVRDMFNDYYLSIGLDKLGPYCPSPLQPGLYASTTTKDGKYVTVNETVRKSHTVRKGENISLIAAKYRCTPSQLASWNKLGKKKMVYAGQRLNIYTTVAKSEFVASTANGNETEDDRTLLTDTEEKALENADTTPAESTKVAVVTKPVPQVQKKYIIHTVAPGDTLFSIAQRYEGTTVAKLKLLNNIKNTHNLRPGMKIKVKVQA